MTHASERLAVPPVPMIIVSILSVQAGAALAKGLFPALGPVSTVGLRIGLSAVILLGAFRPPLRRMTPAQWRAVVPYGLVLGVMNLVYYCSLARIPLGLAVTLEFIGPLGVAVFGSHTAIDVVWGLLAAAGVLLITPWTGGSVDPVGVAFALAAGACWAAYILLGGRVSRMVPGAAAVSAGMLVGALTVLPISVGVGGFAHLTPKLFAAGLGVALLSSAIPYTLEMFALRALPARTFGILMSLEPAAGALVGLVALKEILTPKQWLAVALMCAASTGSTLTSRKPSPEIEAGEGWRAG
jgi:inner membrane transporter RhtA